MSEVVVNEPLVEASAHSSASVLPKLFLIAWRNVWRNKRRTLLTVGGIIFAVWLLVFMRSFQVGVFSQMADMTARAMPGHAQIQDPRYEDEPLMEHTIDASLAKAQLLETRQFEFVSSRLQGSAILSVNELSSAGMLMGVEPKIEAKWSGLVKNVVSGRYISSTGEMFIGESMARNLGASLGDDLIVLGTAKNGGIAAHAGQIVGIFRTGSPEIDRSLVQMHISDFREAWSMDANEAHSVVAIAPTLSESEEAVKRLRNEGLDSKEQRLMGWQDLLPEVVSMTEMKDVSTTFIFFFLALIVVFAVVNAFMMLIYERTNEMGVLLALGMRPHQLLLQFQIEGLIISGVGVILAIGFTLLTLWPLSSYGLALPPSVLEAYPEEFLRNMPKRLYPGLDWDSMRLATVVIVLGVQLAAFIPSLRIFRLRPVEAIKAEN